MAARWGVAVIALLFSSLTMFYHFEFVENICSPVRFGLVDNFQAGIAAIASATFIRSLATSSVRVLFVGIIMASFTVLIKPSGGAVMALLGMSWVVFVSLEWFHFRHCLEISKKLRRYLVLGSMQLFAVYLVITVVCVKSQYLSSENFLFAKQALATMKDELAIDFSQIPLLLHISMGEAIFFWIIGVTVLFIFFCCRSGDLRKRNFFKMSGFLLFASIFWAGGIFFWLVVQVGGSQVRYFHPFFLMGIVCLVPLAVYVWLKSNKWIQFALLLICVLPAGNMALLLMQKNPPLGWQRLTGVSLLVGTNDAVVKEAYNFLEIVRREKCNARIYSFSTELPVAIFESVGMYEGVVNPDSLTFNILRPVDWVRGFVVRVNDLLLSNYICFEPLKEDEVNAMMGLEQIQSFNDENRVFRAWFSMLTEKDGIEIISNSPVCLLEIGDISLFERRIEQFISSRTWRSE
ncbi:hypothetical protein KAI46_15735, partial [bacterium]|nr:hypothetical protein [bacterium]